MSQNQAPDGEAGRLVSAPAGPNCCSIARTSQVLGLLSLAGVFLTIVSLTAGAASRGSPFLWVAMAGLGLTAMLGVASVVCSHLALDRIRKSNGILTGSGPARTGLVLGYAALLMTALFVSFGPTLVKPRTNVEYVVPCINNLRMLDEAKRQWALHNKKGSTDTPTMQDLAGAAKHLRYRPACPAGGTYTLGNLQTKPCCSIPGHTLP